MQIPRFIVVCLLIIAPASLRMLAPEWNVVPIAAIALYCGAHFRNRGLAFSIPLLAMFLGDILLAVQTRNPSLYLFHATMPFVYGCYVFSVAMGIGLQRHWDRLPEGISSREAAPKTEAGRWHSALRARVLPITTLTIAGSILFFLVTNFGCWLMFHTYPKTWHGLLDCYLAGVPYFRGTLCGDLIGSAILFGGEQLLRHDPLAVPQSERF
jgi:hypothetical protein